MCVKVCVCGYQGDRAADRCVHRWVWVPSDRRSRRSEEPTRGQLEDPAPSHSNTCTWTQHNMFLLKDFYFEGNQLLCFTVCVEGGVTSQSCGAPCWSVAASHHAQVKGHSVVLLISDQRRGGLLPQLRESTFTQVLVCLFVLWRLLSDVLHHVAVCVYMLQRNTRVHTVCRCWQVPVGRGAGWVLSSTLWTVEREQTQIRLHDVKVMDVWAYRRAVGSQLKLWHHVYNPEKMF